jgi:hypothetical protein
MDESRRLAMRRAHTRHKGFCTCGMIVSGNGAKPMHAAMHERVGTAITTSPKTNGRPSLGRPSIAPIAEVNTG